MANEIQVTASLTFAKGAILAKQLALNGLNINVTGVNYEMLSQSIPTTAAGEPALLRLNPALAAPAMLANTLAVLVEGLLVEI